MPSFINMVDAAEGRPTDQMDQLRQRLDIPREPGVKTPDEVGKIDFKNFGKQQPKLPPSPDEPRIDTTETVKVWIDAWLLGFDPVYVNKKTWRWASGIRFHDEPKMQATSDLISIDIVPLRGDKSLSLNDIVSMRKEETAFTHLRDTLIACKNHLYDNVSESASTESVRNTCREFIRDNLDPHEKYTAIQLLDDDLVATSALSVGVGALFLTAIL